MPCTVGGPNPGGVNNPCATIHQDCLELWLINEEVGSTAFGYRGVANLTLTPWAGMTVDPSWNHPADTDGGIRFFGGAGATVLPAGLGILSTVGSGFTIAQRRWYTGMEHVIQPVPFSMTGFGSWDHDFLVLSASSGPPVPRIYARPTLTGPGPCRTVVPGGYYRAPTHDPIPGTSLPGVPTDSCPTFEPGPYLVVVTVVATAPGRVTISVFGHDGVGPIPGVCYETNADGSVAHSDGEGDGDVEPGEPQTPTIYGDLRTLRVGGFGCYDTLHQAAIWKRALSASEVAWLGATLNGLRSSIDMPGSLCEGSGGCTEPAGSGTINPLLNADGTTAIHPEFPVLRRDPIGVIVSDGPELRETRRAHEAEPRQYELVWSLASGVEVDRIRQALDATRGGAHYTRWRHPIDDPPGNVCAAPRWRILNAADAAGFIVSRRRGGHVANLRLVLEEVPLV